MISLESFRTNITSDMKGVVLNARGDGFAKASEVKNAEGQNRVSFFQRFFNTEARQQMSFELLDTFHRLISDEFGKVAADTVILHQFGENALSAIVHNDVSAGGTIAKVSGAKILAALKEAETMGIGEADGNAETRAKRLMNQNPATKAECTAMKAEIGRLMNRLVPESTLARDLAAKLVQLQTLSFSELKLTQLSKQLQTFKDAALGVLLRENPGLGEGDRRLVKDLFQSKVGAKLDEMFEALSQTATDGVVEKLPKKTGLTKDFIKNLAGNIAKMTQTAFAKTTEPMVVVPKKLESLVKEERAALMNADTQAWSPVSNTITTSFGSKAVTLQSVQTPASNLEGGGIKASYRRDGMRGVICHDKKQANHAANMAETSFSITDGEGRPKELFKGIRHGVHSAYGIKKDAERAVASFNRAAETAKANFFARSDANDLLRNAQDGESIEFDVTSISLLTLTWPSERGMMADQTKAWESLAKENGGRGLQIQHEGKTLYLKPKMTIFSIGVDFLSSTSLGSILANGMRESSYNLSGESGLASLAGRVDAFLARAARSGQANTPKAQTIRTLMDQIMKLFTGSSLSRADKAYSAVSRIAVLSYLLGDPPCFNCKSGKDRTSTMDTECKFLVAMIELKGVVPEPGAALGDDERKLYRQISSYGGNRELQEYNTGYQGTKSMDYVTDVTNKTGDDYKATLKGNSSLTGS